MTTVPKPALKPQVQDGELVADLNATFLRFLPAVQTHAAIHFRTLPAADREDAISESVATAFVNFKSAYQRGRADKLTPSTVAKYAILHARTGRDVGRSDENTSDVLSRRAQVIRGFEVYKLPSDALHRYDCMRDPTSPVWKALLLEDRRTSVADQATFRLDWSAFLARQTDRTRTAVASLAAGYKRCEVADQLGVTPPAMTQPQRDWSRREPPVEVSLNKPWGWSGSRESLPVARPARTLNTLLVRNSDDGRKFSSRETGVVVRRLTEAGRGCGRSVWGIRLRLLKRQEPRKRSSATGAVRRELFSDARSG